MSFLDKYCYFFFIILNKIFNFLNIFSQNINFRLL